MTAEPDGGVHDGTQDGVEDAGPAPDASAAAAATDADTDADTAAGTAAGDAPAGEARDGAETRPDAPEPVVPAPRAATGAVPAADRTAAQAPDDVPDHAADRTGTAPGEAADPTPDRAADEPAGGRLTARLREARARLEPEQAVIPAPRSPEGVVPPPTFGRAGAAPADLVAAVDQLVAELAQLEGGTEDDPDRRALLRALDLSASGVPEAGWSTGLAAEDLAGAADMAGTLHDAAEALLGRLDAEERAASAVEVDAVVTALRVARVVLDLEAFARHGR
ncbi:hypothetical protein [Actinomycetospora lemnae]|uniref:Uncharacterized protein n=1 Tax=Actinomycetospora lemnae TaxID=3019891 RepID=A0ABT5SVT4_9PSEU|nr:hypothetical protein [Actinomycetospora sp. DW7H6]MDD7966889.1 hypothetical protein [Actinomycetospora sp. DW7H6]